jgi:hypothetical protein
MLPNQQAFQLIFRVSTQVLRERGHCVICVVEGAGQSLLTNTGECDPSGNPVLADIGKFLKSKPGTGLRSDYKSSSTRPLHDRAIPTTSNDRLTAKILAHTPAFVLHRYAIHIASVHHAPNNGRVDIYVHAAFRCFRASVRTMRSRSPFAIV